MSLQNSIESEYYIDGLPVGMNALKEFADVNQIKSKHFRRIGHYCQTVTISQDYNQKTTQRGGICTSVTLQFLFGKITGTEYYPGTQEDIDFYDEYIDGPNAIRASGWKHVPALFGAVLAPNENLSYEILDDVATATVGAAVETAMGSADYVLIIMSEEGGDSTSGAHFLACYKQTTDVKTEYAMFDCNIGEYRSTNVAGVKSFFNTLVNWDKRPRFGVKPLKFKPAYAQSCPRATIVKITKN